MTSVLRDSTHERRGPLYHGGEQRSDPPPEKMKNCVGPKHYQQKQEEWKQLKGGGLMGRVHHEFLLKAYPRYPPR